MNALQYYIIDGFIKEKQHNDHQPVPTEDDDEEGSGVNSWEPDVESEDETTTLKDSRSKVVSFPGATKLTPSSNRVEEYNADIDGDSSTAGSSNSVDKDDGTSHRHPRS